MNLLRMAMVTPLLRGHDSWRIGELKMPFHRWFYGLFRKHVACRLGFHGAHKMENEKLANFCEWGCGHTFTPHAYQPWVVTLRTGEQFEVLAVNAYHAGSQVVHGERVGIDGRTGAALGPVKVHRSNIVSAVPKT